MLDSMHMQRPRNPMKPRNNPAFRASAALRSAVAQLRGRNEADVAPRIREAIDRQRDASERLIGWIQLSVIVGLGVLFLLSPKTHETAVYARPIGWALLAYFLFTLLRLALSYRISLPAWFLALSVVADMLLLLGIIWSFHIDYGQPPAFYLKAPTLLYVFLFISIRALRFDSRYVVLAGCAAAAGWLFMIGYAIFYAGGMSGVTRDYVEYLTANRILLGAEFDKIITIVLVTAILAVAIMRARRTLVRSAEEHAAAVALSRFFSPEIADQITRAKEEIHAGEGQQRDAAILMTDIRGFTRRAAALPANEVIEILTEYQARLVPAIQDNGGSIDKFMGDGILATFGAAVPSPSCAADALRAAEAIAAAADRWAEARQGDGKPVLRVAVAVTAGPLVFGAIGDESRLEYTVIGDPVNLAAKLDKHGKDLNAQIMTTAETLDRAVDQDFEPALNYKRIAASNVADVSAPVDLAYVSAD